MILFPKNPLKSKPSRCLQTEKEKWAQNCELYKKLFWFGTKQEKIVIDLDAATTLFAIGESGIHLRASVYVCMHYLYAQVIL